MIRQGEIHWIELDPALGREQKGRRPGLVLSRNDINRLPLTVLIMAGTGAEHLDATRRYPTDLWVTAAESGLPKDTVFLGLQIRSVDHRRLVGEAGILPPARFGEAQAILAHLSDD